MTRVLLALLLLAPLPAGAVTCALGTVTGTVTYVRDGDTIELGALAIRLNGLAAPEWDTTAGAQATDAMKGLVLGKVVRCQLDGSQTYDRCAAICDLEGADIAAELVSQGFARDCPRYSGGRYEQVELQAAQRGATIGTTYKLPGYCRKR